MNNIDLRDFEQQYRNRRYGKTVATQSGTNARPKTESFKSAKRKKVVSEATFEKNVWIPLMLSGLFALIIDAIGITFLTLGNVYGWWHIGAKEMFFTFLLGGFIILLINFWAFTSDAFDRLEQIEEKFTPIEVEQQSQPNITLKTTITQENGNYKGRKRRSPITLEQLKQYTQIVMSGRVKNGRDVFSKQNIVDGHGLMSEKEHRELSRVLRELEIIKFRKDNKPQSGHEWSSGGRKGLADLMK